MIRCVDTISGSPCYLCGDPLETGHWVLWEFAVDQWELICVECSWLADETGDVEW